jgi:hypothetical protein
MSKNLRNSQQLGRGCLAAGVRLVSALVYSVISEQVPKAVVLPSITFTYSLMAASLITLLDSKMSSAPSVTQRRTCLMKKEVPFCPPTKGHATSCIAYAPLIVARWTPKWRRRGVGGVTMNATRCFRISVTSGPHSRWKNPTFAFTVGQTTGLNKWRVASVVCYGSVITRRSHAQKLL